MVESINMDVHRPYTQSMRSMWTYHEYMLE